MLVNYAPGGVPNGSGSANRVMINDLSGAPMICNTAILNLATPPAYFFRLRAP